MSHNSFSHESCEVLCLVNFSCPDPQFLWINTTLHFTKLALIWHLLHGHLELNVVTYRFLTGNLCIHLLEISKNHKHEIVALGWIINTYQLEEGYIIIHSCSSILNLWFYNYIPINFTNILLVVRSLKYYLTYVPDNIIMIYINITNFVLIS